MIKLVWINKHILTGYHPESLKYHKTGKYVPKNNDPYNEHNEGRIYSKCNLVMEINPYGLHGTSQINYYLLIREDIASKIASPCKRCYPKRV